MFKLFITSLLGLAGTLLCGFGALLVAFPIPAADSNGQTVFAAGFAVFVAMLVIDALTD